MPTAAAKTKPGVVVKAYQGDGKTLLAFNLPASATHNLAGFTIQCKPPGQNPYYIYNELQFADPGKHAQDPKEPAYSSINGPIHKFRWLHVPGQAHQGLQPVWGKYTYVVTPRYFDASQSMLPLDPNLSVSVAINVAPFATQNLTLGFTRGYTQSQAFVRHFGLKAAIKPANAGLIFDTNQQSGANAQGQAYTYEDEYVWLGFTARQKVYEILDAVLKNKSLRIDAFFYDLSDTNAVQKLLALAKQGRIRIILDDAALHHIKPGTRDKKTGKLKTPPAEDQFEELFKKAKTGKAAILRGHFNRYSHDKVMIVYDGKGAQKVLTGSTNISTTGLYVNSNHVLVFDDRKVANQYAAVFEESWKDQVKAPAFRKSPLSSAKGFSFTGTVPKTLITFSPHTDADVQTVLKRVTDRISQEYKAKNGSVIFAVMELGAGKSTGKGKATAKKTSKKPPQNPVYDLLNKLHKNTTIFSYGVSDNPDGVALYKPGNKTGVLVTGKPVHTRLPAPFNQVPGIGGVGHQIHHKFVVCGFNGNNPVVFCGSSNLAGGGEAANGDNLLMISDGKVATAFAIEALALVDTFNFLDKYSEEKKKQTGKKPATPPAVKQQAAASAGWHLSTNDKWVKPYYDSKDLHCADRELFG